MGTLGASTNGLKTKVKTFEKSTAVITCDVHKIASVEEGDEWHLQIDRK